MKHRQAIQNNLSFRLMALEFRIRDWWIRPSAILRRVGVTPGMTVLDFGCGPGGFTMAAAELVRPDGLVYAIDIHPLAITRVREATAKRQLRQVVVISAGDLEAIPEGVVDLALLYDVLHDLDEPDLILFQLSRKLKANGRLSVSDHHLRDEGLRALVQKSGLFQPISTTSRTVEFRKAEEGFAIV